MYFEDHVKKRLIAKLDEHTNEIIQKVIDSSSAKYSKDIMISFWVGVFAGIIISIACVSWYLVIRALFP